MILAKTIKGYGMGEAGEAQNITHQQKKMGTTSLRAFRDRFALPIADETMDDIPYLTFDNDSPESIYMHQRRQALGALSTIVSAKRKRCRYRRYPHLIRCSRLAARGENLPPPWLSYAYSMFS